MDENTGTIVEQTAEAQDAFMSGWDDETVADVSADQSAEVEAAEAAGDAGEADRAAGAEAAEAKPEEARPEGETAPEGGEKPEQPAAQAQDAGAPELPKTWKIKHNGQEVTVNAEEMTTLLQKGYDYDRVRARYDEQKGVMDLFGKFAKDAGMSVPDYTKFLRVEVKKSAGMTEDEAKREVALEDREAAVAVKEAAEAEEAKAKEDSAAKIRADLSDFAKAFPDVYAQAQKDPKAIPESVWAEMQSGLSLTAAYSRYAVAQAVAQATAAREAAEAKTANSRNAERSTGSLRSAGNGEKKDSFLSGFSEG